MKYFISPIVLFLGLVSLHAQTGPAGLGTTDGSSTLELWLRADQGVVETNGVVSSWGDISGNGRTFSQSNSSERPDFADNAINGKPTIDWTTSANTHLIGPTTSDLFGASGVDPTAIGDIIIVHHQSVGSHGYILQARRTVAGSNSFLAFMTNGGSGNPADENDDDLGVFIRETSAGGDWEVVSSEGTGFENAYPSAPSGVYYATRFGFDPTDAGDNDEFWLYDIDDLIQETTSLNINYDDGDGLGDILIGGNDGSRAYDGETAEIMVFSERLTDVKYIIIQNYLNARYALATSNDFYAGDTNGNGDADFGVIGIGQDASGTVNTASQNGLSITANTGMDNGDYVFAGYTSLTEQSNAVIDNDNLLSGGGTVDARMKRSWYIDETDANTSLTTDIVFDLDDADLGNADMSGATASDYKLLYRAGTSGDWTIAASANAFNDTDNTITFTAYEITADGYYTVATSDEANSSLGDIQQIWYSFQSGSWGDFNSWTLDGATTPVFDNDNSEIPGSGDKVILTSGRTIRMYDDDSETTLQNNVTVQSIEIRSSAKLRLLTSTGHDLGDVSGAGTIALQGAPNTGSTAFIENLPEGDYTEFADQLLGGTVELSAATAGVPLLLNQDYASTSVITDANGAVSRSMTINMGLSTDVVILQRDLYLNSNLTVTRGQFRMHRNASEAYADVTFSDADLTATILNTLTVATNGAIRTGTANQRHQMNIYGNATFNGTAYFTQRTTIDAANEATDGIVDLNFLNQEDDQALACNAVVRLYRIEIDKAAPTVFLNITAAAPANFNLFGAADYDIDVDLEAGDSNENAFALVTGGVSLGSNVNVTTLNTTGNYAISSLATLQLDGGWVRKTGGAALVPYGSFILNSGLAEFLVQSGITLRDAGRIEINGGSLYANAIRTSIQASGDAGSYIQTGGDVVLNGGTGVGSSTTGIAATNTDYYVFTLTQPDNVFRMSGGTLTVQNSNYNDVNGTPSDDSDDLGGSLFINSNSANYDVTGGTVIVDMADGNPAKITSKAPFYNLTLTNTSGNAIADNDGTEVLVQPGDESIVFLAGGQVGDGAGDATMTEQPLVVLNDLIIGDGTNPIRFDHIGNDVTIGRNFTISLNAQYYFGDDDLLPASAAGTGLSSDSATPIPATHQNTTTFSGTIDGTLSMANLNLTQAVTGASNAEIRRNEQVFFNVTVNKTSDSKITLSAPNKDASGSPTTVANAFRTGDDSELRVEAGTLDQGDRAMRLFGDVYNAGVLSIFEPGVTSVNAIVKFRPSNFALETEPGAEFGNLQLASEDQIITLDNNVTIRRLSYTHGRLYIGSSNLIIDELDLSINTNQADFGGCGGCLSVEDMIITDGNASDGGLTLKITSATNPIDGNTNNISGNAILNAQDDDDFLFPLGIGTSGLDDGSSKYTPVFLSISNVGDLGVDGEAYITVNPVNSTLETTNQAFETLTYFWRVRTEGFDTEPTIDYLEAFGHDDDVPTIGNIGTYVPGYVEDGGSYTRTAEATAIERAASPDFESTDYSVTFNGGGSGFTLGDLNFTAGESGAFSGAPLIFYSKVRSTGNQGDGAASNNSSATGIWQWEDPDTWTRSDITGFDASSPHRTDNPSVVDAGATGNQYPQNGDIAIIGFVPFDDPIVAERGDPQVVNAGVDGGGLSAASSTAVSCAELSFTNMVDIAGDPAPNNEDRFFGERPTLMLRHAGAQIDASSISGEGFIFINNGDPDFSAIDIGDFVSQDSSFIFYEIVSVSTLTNVPDELPNVILGADGFGGNDRDVVINKDVTINGILELFGDINFVLSTGASGDVTVMKDMYVYERNTFGTPSGGGAEVIFPNTGNARNFTVFGDISVDNEGAQIYVESPAGTTPLDHMLTVGGSIAQSTTSGGGFQLFSAAGEDRITLNVVGDESESFTVTSGADPSLYRVIVNKGNSISTTFTFNNNFTLPDPTIIGSGEYPLEILNGLAILDDATIDIELADATTGDYLLPNTNDPEASSGSGGLEIKSGIARIAGDDTGLLLDGQLILSGGDLDMSDCTSNGNNYIEYSSTGQASITINDAASTLSVGSQIRRNFFSDAGILDLTVSAGNLEIGACTEGDVRRGMLEIVNDFSSFTHTGGTITFLEQNGTDLSANVASLLLEPATSDLSGSTIVIDLVDANDVKFGINSAIALNNLTIQSDQGLGANGNSEVVQMVTRTLTIDGDLTMDDNVELRSNNLDLTLNGDFTLNDLSSYTPGLNKTIFNVATGETNNLNGTSTSGAFYDFEKTGDGTLVLGKDITVTGATLDLSEGVLDDVGNLIDFSGQQLNNSATHASSSNVVNAGIRFNRSGSQQILTTDNDGIFGNITIDNENGVSTPDLSQEYRVNNQMTLADGILDIGPALLIFGQTAELTNALDAGTDLTDFTETNQIQSNSSIIDFGVEKEFALGETDPFVFPIGEDNRYTPVKVDFLGAGGNSGTTDGSLRLRPRNDVAPIMLSEDQATQDGVLQYHWLINEEGMDGFTANIIADYDDDVIGTDSESTYRGARAIFTDPNLSVENPFPGDNSDLVDDVTNFITFPISGEDDFSGEYFAGDPSKIPDNFAALIFDNNSGDGLYSTPGNYVEDTNGNGIIDGGETNRPTLLEEVNGGVVRIADGVTMSLDQNGVQFSRLVIPSNGTLEVDGTNGHLLGQVSGTGTIRIVTDAPNTDAALPGGDYNTFFDCASGGGALEYDGTGDYTVLTGGISEVRTLTLSGAGEKTFADVDINICEDLNLDGGTVIFPDNKTVTVGNDLVLDGADAEMSLNSNLVIENDLVLTSGTLTGGIDAAIDLSGDMTLTGATLNLTGSDAATLNLIGSSTQTITGDYSGANSIAAVVINNSVSGDAIVISGTLGIDEELTLTDGILLTEQTDFRGTEPFTIGSVVSFSSTAIFSGGSNASFVDGVVCKEGLLANTTFRFPTGDNNIFAPVSINEDATGGSTWKARYIYSNPQSDLNAEFDNLGTETEVSSREYWVVQTADVQTATISIEYGTQSGVVIPSETTVVSIQDGDADGIDADDQWEDIGRGGLSSGADATGGRIDANDASSFSANFYTVAGQTETALPVELLSFTGVSENGIITLEWSTASELNNDFFEIQKSLDGASFETIGTVQGSGTSEEIQDYMFIDAQPASGINYYRLKQVDLDGAENIHEVISIENNFFRAGIEVTIYPNPTHSQNLNIRLATGDDHTPIVVRLVDFSGKEIHVSSFVGEFNFDERVDIQRSIPSGTYLLIVEQGAYGMKQKLIIK